MIISAKKIYDILNKIDFSQQENLLLSFNTIEGFKFQNNKNDLHILEDELNDQFVLEEYISIRDIANHLNVSKPTIKKILHSSNIDILYLNSEEKILKSEYLKFLINAKNKKSEE